MEATLSGLNGAPVTPTAGILGIEPAPALHLYLEELNVMGRQEKNLQVYAMEGTAVLEVKQKCSFLPFLRNGNTSIRLDFTRSTSKKNRRFYKKVDVNINK